MINNYLEYEYQPSSKVYTHPTTSHSIFIGDIQAALDLNFIQQQRILTVVTASAGMEHVTYDSSITHIVYPLLDMKAENIAKFFTQFYDLVEQQIKKGNILVHCSAGISRSSTLVTAYLMKKNNWSFKEAIAFIRTSRPKVLPNLGFERQLKEYQGILKQQREVKDLQRRNGSKTSQQKKHSGLIEKSKILPEINYMGRTQLKPKILDLFSEQEKLEKQSSQRSRRSTSTRNRNELEFYGTRRAAFKPLKSKSIVDKSPLLIANFPTQQNSLHRLKGSMPIEHVNQVMVHRLQLNDKKIATERQLRIKPLHKLAYY